ncbi:MAG: hypothetical protein HRT37_15370 [Alteromonadaceae bacterium]|nr:hypothetical protein [Alteromonadaceae bacterium]
MSLKKITQLIAFVFIGWIIQTRAYASSDESLVACNDVMGKVHSLNAYELWQGANVCGRADDLNRATFLILSGQIRAMTDMGVLTPASDEDEIQVGELHYMENSIINQVVQEMTKFIGMLNKQVYYSVHCKIGVQG